jgi:hypothetical protein
VSNVTTEMHQAYMAALFDHIVGKFEVAINVRPPQTAGANAAIPAASSHGSNANASANGSAHTDGMAAIAMLAVLTDFEASFREAMVIQYTSSSSTANQRQRKPFPAVCQCPGGVKLSVLCV